MAQHGNRSLTLTLGTLPLPPLLKRVEVEINIAGEHFLQKVFPPDFLTPFTYTWDGLDGYGRPAQGPHLAEVTIRYVFPAFYNSGGSFGGGGGGGGSGPSYSFFVSPPLLEVSFPTKFNTYLGTFDPKPLGLGGLTIDAHHEFSTDSGTLYYGTGHTATLSRNLRVTTVAGTINGAVGGDHVPTAATKILTQGGAFGPDGLFYYADQGRVHVLTNDGFTDVVVGRPGGGDDGDGGPALTAGIQADLVEFGPDGTMYVQDSTHHRVRQVRNGIISAFAGTGVNGVDGDNGPATSAAFASIQSVRADAFGNVYIVDANGLGSAGTIRRVRPDGIIVPFAGSTSGTPLPRAFRQRRRTSGGRPTSGSALMAACTSWMRLHSRSKRSM